MSEAINTAGPSPIALNRPAAATAQQTGATAGGAAKSGPSAEVKAQANASFAKDAMAVAKEVFMGASEPSQAAQDKAAKATEAVMKGMDRDKDGSLDTKELDAWVGKSAEAQSNAKAIDTNKDGKLSKSEIQGAYAKSNAKAEKTQAIEKSIANLQVGMEGKRAAFDQAQAAATKDTNAVMKAIDGDKNGSLDAKETAAWVGQGADAAKTVERIDANKDGQLSKEEIQGAYAAKYTPEGAADGKAQGDMLKAAEGVLDIAGALTDAAKSAIAPAQKALEAAGLKDTVGQALDGLGEQVKGLDAKITEAKATVEKLKPMEFSDAEKAQIQATVPVLEKMAGADGVWTAGDRAQNLNQMQGSLNQRVDGEIANQAAAASQGRGPLRTAIKTAAVNHHMAKNGAGYKADGMNQANGIASHGMFDGQKQLGIPNNMSNENGPSTPEGQKAAQQPISIREMEQFSDTMRMIEAKANAAGKPSTDFERGLPVQFLRDMASSNQPVIPAGATLKLAAFKR